MEIELGPNVDEVACLIDTIKPHFIAAGGEKTAAQRAAQRQVGMLCTLCVVMCSVLLVR